MFHRPLLPRHAVSVAFVSVHLAACSGASADADDPALESSSPIVGGRRDHGDAAVVAIDIDGKGLCSGTLIHPRVVLTARHCVSETTESVACPARTTQVIRDHDPATLTILVGDDVATAEPVALGEALEVPRAQVLCNDDIALIRLDRSVERVAPASVNLSTSLEVGGALRMVGFGKRGDTTDAGRKYQRKHVPILGVSPAEFVVGEVSCNGDSGGPAFDETTSAVVGVVSRGGPGCRGAGSRNTYTRTDAFATLVRRAIKNAGTR